MELTVPKKTQIRTIILLSFPLWFSAFISFGYIFTAGDLEHRCFIPECEDTNSSTFLPPWLEYALPMTGNHTPSECEQFGIRENYHECSENKFLKNEMIICNQWIYKDPENTIVREFNLTCQQNDWKRTSVGTFGNIAASAGLLLNGILSDRYGRRKMLVIVGSISAVTGILQSFSTSYIMFISFEIINAFICDVYTLSILLGLEIAQPSKRVLINAILSSYFTLGELWVVFSMWLTKDWRNMLRLMYGTGCIFPIYYWLLPESKQWLLSRRNSREEKLLTLSNITKKTIKCVNTRNIKEKRDCHCEIFKSKTLIIRALLCSMCWIANTFVYYGLSITSVSLAGDKYINYSLVSLSTIPAYLFMLSAYKIKRRLILCSSLGLAGIACLLSYATNEDYIWLTLILFLSGKFFITVSFSIIYLYTAEMFPTPTRHKFVNLCSMIARIGSILAPQTPILMHYIDPKLVFGFVALTASLITLSLPETHNKKLPDTIQEAKDLRNNKQ